MKLGPQLFVSFRTFRLRLRRNAAAFSQNFTVMSEDGFTNADLSHIYSGTLEGWYGRENVTDRNKLSVDICLHSKIFNCWNLKNKVRVSDLSCLKPQPLQRCLCSLHFFQYLIYLIFPFYLSFSYLCSVLTSLTLDFVLQVKMVQPAMALCYRVSLREPSIQTTGLIT